MITAAPAGRKLQASGSHPEAPTRKNGRDTADEPEEEEKEEEEGDDEMEVMAMMKAMMKTCGRWKR